MKRPFTLTPKCDSFLPFGIEIWQLQFLDNAIKFTDAENVSFGPNFVHFRKVLKLTLTLPLLDAVGVS